MRCASHQLGLIGLVRVEILDHHREVLDGRTPVRLRDQLSRARFHLLHEHPREIASLPHVDFE